jgi:hypothetical protein
MQLDRMLCSPTRISSAEYARIRLPLELASSVNFMADRLRSSLRCVRYRLVHEVVIVLSDLYLSQEPPERWLPDGIALPGLTHAARFAKRATLKGGWRPWLARWLGRDELAAATVAAATVGATAAAPNASDPTASAQTASAPTTSTVPVPEFTVWMATPVHLVAGLTSLHLDRRSILRLPSAELTTLAAEFQRVFHDSGFRLQPLDTGGFLLFGPPVPLADTLEPARSMGENVADGMRGGTGATALRRLGAEIEMWLHDHAVNDARKSRGQPPVTGLWLWGGGPVPPVSDDRAATRAAGAIAFGSDAYLQGLWAGNGANVLPLPPQLAGIFSYPQAQRAVLVIEVGDMLHANPRWTFFDAIAQIDTRFMAPAVAALRRGDVGRLVLLANDRELTVRARDRFKFWRRALPGLSGLQ